MERDPRATRRKVLQLGCLGAAGLTLPQLLQAESASRPGLVPRADSCVLIYLNGGASHLDMWDMKPDAPDGIRGEFKSIATSAPEIRLCEHLPRLARQMHRFSLVRSLQHSVNNAHAAAVYTSITGHDRGDNSAATFSSKDYPTLGAVVSWKRPPRADQVSHAVLPYMTKEGAAGPPQPGFYGGFLGRGADPLFILKDPNVADFAVPELSLTSDLSAQRLRARQLLLGSLDDNPREKDAPRKAMHQFRERAVDLLTSTTAQQAMNISLEPANVRDAYGRNIYGQSVLLARRLIEAGTRVVTISWAPDANATWDTHAGNFVKLRETLLPQFDMACGSLVEDLVDRGLFERTMVVVLGDFGRTPKINGNNAGRDHWNFCYTVMLGGGGLRGGYVHGASDKIGAFPARDALGPGDVIATIYRQFGIAPDQFIRDQFDRPHRLVPQGDAIAALVA